MHYHRCLQAEMDEQILRHMKTNGGDLASSPWGMQLLRLFDETLAQAADVDTDDLDSAATWQLITSRMQVPPMSPATTELLHALLVERATTTLSHNTRAVLERIEAWFSVEEDTDGVPYYQLTELEQLQTVIEALSVEAARVGAPCGDSGTVTASALHTCRVRLPCANVEAGAEDGPMAVMDALGLSTRAVLLASHEVNGTTIDNYLLTWILNKLLFLLLHE